MVILFAAVAGGGFVASGFDPNSGLSIVHTPLKHTPLLSSQSVPSDAFALGR